MQTTIPDINTDIEKSLVSESKVLPHRSNWASTLGDPCWRKLVYYRTDWDKQTPPDARLQGIFNTGSKLERVVKNILNEIGREAKPQWELVDTGIQLNDKFLREHQIGGEPDTFLKVWNGDSRPEILGPCEIKSVTPTIYNQITDLNSMKKYSWMARYFSQLYTYEIGSNFETGWFLLFNKANLWDIKFLELPLDYTEAEKLINTADAINAHVEAGTFPDKINDPDICPDCPFNSICCPDYTVGGNIKIDNTEELEGVLIRLEELGPISKEISELERERDALLVEGQNTIAGRFMILWKEITATKKPSKGGEYSYWRKKIIKNETPEPINT